MISKSARAREMRALPDEVVDELVAASSNVIDLRATFIEKRKQIELAKAYRGPARPRGAA